MKTNRYLSMYLGHDASISIYDGNVGRFHVVDLEKFSGIKHLSMRKSYAEPEVPDWHDPQYWESKKIEHKDQNGKDLGYTSICYGANVDYILSEAIKEWAKQNDVEPTFDAVLIKLAASRFTCEQFLKNKLPETIKLLKTSRNLRVKYYGGSTHHRSHAWCGFGQSGFTDAMAIVWDVVGDNEPTTVWEFENGKLKFQERQEDLATPDSPATTHWRIMRTFGRVYNNVGTTCKALSNTKELLDIAGKLMGLSAYGERNDQTELLCKQFDIESQAKLKTFEHNGPEVRQKDPKTGAWMIRLNVPNDEPTVKDKQGRQVTWGIDFKNYAELNWDIAAMLGKPGYKRGKWRPNIDDAPLSFHMIDGQQQYDLAWAAQEWLERSLLHLVEEFYHKIVHEHGGNLVISGGCALNVLANARLKKEYPNLNIFVPPSPGDNGLSTGMLIEFLVEQGVIDTRHHHSMLRNLSMSGLRMQKREFYEKHWKKDFRPVDLGIISTTLKSGKIIGLIQGQCESGPRSLGNRSILCDPSYPNMKNILNKKVKFRESFRPFAPVCRIDDAPKYFDSQHFRNMEFMGYSCHVKQEHRETLAAITHVDGTARLQTVDRFTNPLLYDILTEFDGVLLNTSFNVQGKPILNDYVDAHRILHNSDLDHVVILDDEDGKLYMTKAKGK